MYGVVKQKQSFETLNQFHCTREHTCWLKRTQWNISYSVGSKIVQFCDCSVFAISRLYLCRLWISIMSSLKQYFIFCFRSWSYCRCPVSICLWLVHCYLNQMQRSCTNGKHWNENSHFKGYTVISSATGIIFLSVLTLLNSYVFVWLNMFGYWVEDEGKI